MSKVSQVYLAIGTNLGERQKNLQRAVDALGEVVAVEAVSPIYKTAPWGITDQPDFLNACLVGQTILMPQELLGVCKTIEQQIGRKPGIRWGPRLIDIDIIFFGRQILSEDGLTLPHPEVADRAFVLAPLADIAPDYVHPQNGRTVAEMLSDLGASSVERLQRHTHRLQKPVRFAWGIKTYIMGILNATTDSFSGDGLVKGSDWVELAVKKAVEFVEQGADVLDIGGESTRPGSSPISEDEELARVVPVIEAVRSYVDVPISVDTYRAGVADAGLKAGANWVNDVWGLRMDPEMVSFVANAGCPLVIMHNRSKPKNVAQEEQLGGRYVGIKYSDLIHEIRQELSESVEMALQAGITSDQIIIDPGLGFGKTVAQNLELLNKIDLFRDMDFPILVGPSRKSFIGYTLNQPTNERLEGTAAAVAIAIARGVDIVRVHDVKSMALVARMTDAIVR